MKLSINLLFLGILVYVLVQSANAQIPRTLSYQGVLTDTSGNPRPDGSYNFTFRIYPVSSGGTALWTETKSLQVKRGLFSTALGDVVSLAGLAFNAPYWLSVQVAAEPELSPRMVLTSAGYSFRAIRADTALSGGPWQVNGSNISYEGDYVTISNSSQDPYHRLLITSGMHGLRVQTDNAGGSLASFGGLGEFAIDSPFVPAGRLVVKEGGNVGIGKTNPAFRLDVGGIINATDVYKNGVPFSGLTLPFYGSVSTNGAVFGVTNSAATGGVGLFAQSNSTDGQAVFGVASGLSTSGYGVYGAVEATSGTNYGVYGQVRSTSGYGVYGAALATGGTNYGVYGTTSSAISGYAGYFSGRVTVTGILSKGGGSFKIDHPLDPANKYLYHSFIESPDMMNVYNGNVMLDASGNAWVQLPEWFGALNKEFRYQLTAIGAPGPKLYIGSEIQNNRFQIAGGSPGMKVSWQVTGIRKDAFAEKYRIPVEEEKQGEERGRYMHPEVFGLSKEMAIPSNQSAKESIRPTGREEK